MSDATWEKVREIFDSALRWAPEERQAYVREACGDNMVLLQEVESLLASHARSREFMEIPAVQNAARGVGNEANQLDPGVAFGRYEIIKQIGAGAMGEVYLARDTSLERKVALKILPPLLAEDEDRMRRFVIESRSASALNHPNIITIYEIGETDGTHFIAAEYIDGGTLRDRLGDVPLDCKSALDIAVQIASALDAAHRAGVIHRDIKPENLMIRPDGLVKIVDFGIAKLSQPPSSIGTSVENGSDSATRIKAHTSPGMIIGTAAYMSPEQARGAEVDARSDIFSFGAMLYEMLSGKPPFTGAGAIEIISSILNKEPVPLSRQDLQLPDDVERIINKTLRKDREERYQTAKEILIDLNDVKKELEFQINSGRVAVQNRQETKNGFFKTRTSEPATRMFRVDAQTADPETGKAKPSWWRYWLPGLIFLAMVGLAYHYFTPPTNEIESIAVLPFENTGGDVNLDYLSDGVSEGVIDRLSQFPQLKIISRSSSFKYRGKDLNLPEIAVTLGVDAIVTGRVVARGNSYQIRVELTDAHSNKQIWGSSFTRQISDISLLQNDISREIVENLSLRLSRSASSAIDLGTSNPQAYEAFAKGRFYLNKAGPDNLKKAIEHFEQAVISDPNYAIAYSYLAFSYAWIVGRDADPGQVKVKSRAAALKAVQLGPTLPDAHFALARVRFLHWEWTEAEAEWKRAIDLNPNFARAHSEYATFLSMMNRDEEAFTAASRAVELDPLDYISSVIFTHTLWHMRRYDETIAAAKKALALDPNFIFTHTILGGAYMGKGMYKEAIAQYKEAIRVRNGDDPGLDALLGAAYAVAGDRVNAQAILRKLESRPDGLVSARTEQAVLYDSLGMRDEAFSSLEKAYAERAPHLGYIRAYPHFDSLRKDPRFQDLMRRMGLPE